MLRALIPHVLACCTKWVRSVLSIQQKSAVQESKKIPNNPPTVAPSMHLSHICHLPPESRRMKGWSRNLLYVLQEVGSGFFTQCASWSFSWINFATMCCSSCALDVPQMDCQIALKGQPWAIKSHQKIAEAADPNPPGHQPQTKSTTRHVEATHSSWFLSRGVSTGQEFLSVPDQGRARKWETAGAKA